MSRLKGKRALISVYDKTGVAGFAKALTALGIEIISTGGTADLLKKEGVPVYEVSEITKFPEMLNGRVKTLHPSVHAGLLAIRDNPKHMETLAAHNIKPIDFLVVNLYPFWDAVRQKTAEAEIIEMIDIGGPAMLRSAAKNFKSVAVVSDPADYPHVAEELKNQGQLGPETLRRLAAKVFKHTSHYDSLIYGYFNGSKGTAAGESFPQNLALEFEKDAMLRYGENPHQKGALYRQVGDSKGIVNAKKLQGKELSFNNYLDLDAAWSMILDFKEPACAIVKHMNPCGFAVGKDPLAAFKAALDCDPLSAFGGIIAFNGGVDAKTAQAILDSGFVECVIAESFKKDALKLFLQKKNLRILSLKPDRSDYRYDFKKISGGLLLQDHDLKDPAEQDLKCVTKKKPTKAQIQDLLFAFRVCRYPRSNTIVIAKDGKTVGLGMGQPSRVDSCHTAFRKAGKRAKGAVLASDGFFPKPDSIALAKKSGIASIIKPGGSVQDQIVIEAANKAGISMVFTEVRHFKH